MEQDVSMVTKGLNCCLRTGIPNCKECPYKDICYHDEPCKTLLFHASRIIHEQQAEIELLKEHEELLTKLGYRWTGSGETLALCKRKDGVQAWTS